MLSIILIEIKLSGVVSQMGKIKKILILFFWGRRNVLGLILGIMGNMDKLIYLMLRVEMLNLEF